QIAKHEQRLLVRNFAVVEPHVVKHGAVQLQDIGPAVVIVVEKLHRDAAQQNRFVSDAGAKRIVIEGAIVIVVVQAIQFEIKMRDVDILPAVAVDVGGVDAHAGFVAAIFAGGDSGSQRDILERSVVLVEEKKIRPG